MRVSKLVTLVGLAFLAACFVPLIGNAQTATSSLRGVVSDPANAVVSGATVVLSRTETGFSQTTTTDHEGAYQFLQLPPATYTLNVTAAGFAPVKQEGVRLLVNVPSTLNVRVQVQGQSIQVEVSGAAEVVNTQDATLGHAFGTEKIDSLPFEGRDPVSILSLQPGVVFTGSS
ncbi:MAG: carboxypeptidase regulatory-like domain-containing protein, partial [Acidobacteriales bacterium]|nr:carboxypeptidase regulatory-like domain-containing protein [Terriglobales bacterium]